MPEEFGKGPRFTDCSLFLILSGRLPFDIVRDCYFDQFGRQGGDRLAGREIGEKEIERREKSRKPDPFKLLTRSEFCLP